MARGYTMPLVMPPRITRSHSSFSGFLPMMASHNRYGQAYNLHYLWEPVRGRAGSEQGEVSIHEGIVHQDGVLALGAGGEERHRGLDQLLEPAHIFDALSRKLGPGAGAAGRLRPAFHGLVDRLDARLRRLRRREI